VIIEKTYKFSYKASKDIDELIEVLASDVRDGYTTKELRRLNDTLDIGTISKPDYEVVMIKKYMVKQ
jgi:hypothetical protein